MKKLLQLNTFKVRQYLFHIFNPIKASIVYRYKSCISLFKCVGPFKYTELPTNEEDEEHMNEDIKLFNAKIEWLITICSCKVHKRKRKFTQLNGNHYQQPKKLS